MSDQKAKITVVTPALNEKFFIRGWLENVKRFADEIIVCDTGSIDSTYMFLYKAARKDNRVHVYLWHDVNFRPYEWPEHEIRNDLLKRATGDWIVPLDADELLDDFGISFLNRLKEIDPSSAHWKFGKFQEYKFWGDTTHLRKRSLWPPFKTVHRKTGLHETVMFPNWRGMYPSWQIRIFHNHPDIKYAVTGNHCVLTYKGIGRLMHRNPLITHKFGVPFFHYHYAFKEKQNDNRPGELRESFKLIEFTGNHPKEIGEYGSLAN